jgi:hypothetical protein
LVGEDRIELLTSRRGHEVRYVKRSKGLFSAVFSVLVTLLFSSTGFCSPGPLPGMVFVEIPGETDFMWGRMEDRFGDVTETGEPVSVRGFEIMTTEVTQGQWLEIMGELTFNIPDDTVITGIGPEYPMIFISLDDCLEFIEILNAMDTCYVYRLPTNLEWVYACRAGTYTPFYWGDDSLTAISHNCWYQSNSEGVLHPVGTKAPNQWGLYDMCGSVMEWCLYGTGYEMEDPETGSTVRWQPLRGGSWLCSAYVCIVNRWVLSDSAYSYQDTGFRVVRSEPFTIYDPLEENRFAVFAEPALSVGGIQHDFHKDDIEQFGYNVKGGCEQDGAYLRVGVGKHFGRFSTFAYGEVGYLGPGCLIDNHGPWILPEVLLNMTVFSGGLELRYLPVRLRFGYGSYSGTAEVDYDFTGAVPTDSWTTDIVDGRGFHFGAGICEPVNENISAGVEWVQHFIQLRLAESGTGVEPTEHEATQYELRFFVTFGLLFD